MGEMTVKAKEENKRTLSVVRRRFEDKLAPLPRLWKASLSLDTLSGRQSEEVERQVPPFWPQPVGKVPLLFLFATRVKGSKGTSIHTTFGTKLHFHASAWPVSVRPFDSLPGYTLSQRREAKSGVNRMDDRREEIR
ncbi:unnamed protein product [Protopolystoma xenopodis]|uniref:Uncharacterized protein n=1 Tax=Protopolystoma xenopodis TaxID=117903 RepID=A0A3S5ARZ3_9PLAT|nr:unnamed protein product [Protopolystoma xenopodis]